MAWVTFSSTANVAGYGNAMLQYDDSSTTSPRSCRLQFNLNAGASIYVYFNNVTINGNVVASQVLVTGTTTVWSGSLGAGQNYTFQFTCPWGTGAITYSGSGTLPSGASAPTGLTVSNLRIGTDSLTATVSISGWGGTGDATTRYRNLAVYSGPDTSYPRKNLRVYGNSLSSDITVDNTITGGFSTIEPNTRYWYYASASNGTYSTTTSLSPFVTYPLAATISLDSTSITQAVINYSILADGGYYDKALQYSLDNGTTWVDAVQITGGSATSGTFTIPGLTGGTTYTLKSRVRTTAGGYTENQDITFTTENPLPTAGFYGSVNGRTKRVDLLYGSVNDQSAFIVKVYGSDNGLTKRIY